MAEVIGSHGLGAASCPVAVPAGAQSAPLAAGAGMVVYRTGFEVDIDGAPNAYHVSGSNQQPGGGLEHICSGADVDDLQNGTLVNRFPSFAVPGSSERCRQAYLGSRAAGFPACSSGTCIRFYGVVTTRRACGFPPHRADGGCGTPVQQKSAQGQPLDFYVSATSWQRRGGSNEDQSSYLDARFVPYLVYDGSRLGQFGVKLGDIALAAFNGRATFAIFGDGGSHLSEASVATLNRLKGKPDVEIPNARQLGIASGASVVAFADSARLLDPSFPVATAPDGSASAAKQIVTAGQQAVQRAGGMNFVIGCVGLSDASQIASQ